MKKANTWITLIAIIILGFVGFYLLQENKTPEEKTYSEIINGEVVVLDHPLTTSFSNNASNTESNGQSSSIKKYSVAKFAQKVAQPFILGFYYMKNLDKVGVEGCNLLSEDEAHNVDFPEYDEDNFRLTNVTIEENNAFIFVEADEIPKKVCAQMIQFNNFTNNIFEGIHIIIK